MKPLLKFLQTKSGRYLSLMVVLFVLIFSFFHERSGGHRLKRTRYNVAVDRSWYPLPVYGKGQNLLGFTDELLDAIGKESEIGFNLITVEPLNLIEDLENGKVDAVISTMPVTYQSLLKYRFTETFYSVGSVLLVASSSPIKSLEELSGHFVGIRRGMSLSFDVPFPNANIVPYDNMSLAFTDLESKKIDGIITDALQAYVQTHGIYTGSVKIILPPLTQEGLRLVTLNKRRYAELIELFDKSLKTLKENGTYDEILERWNLL